MAPSRWNDDTWYSFIPSLPSSAGYLLLAAATLCLAVLKRTVSEWPDLCGNAIRDLHTAALMCGNSISRT